MKKKEDFCRESNHFLKSLGLALCLVSFGGSAIYASSQYAQRTMLSIQMNDRTVEDVSLEKFMQSWDQTELENQRFLQRLWATQVMK